ncbi:MAG: MarR family winged helix-turn-helix transcriptional regulator [Anaerostipes hadrus]
METGKIINRISNRLQRFSPNSQNKLGIGQAQANILRFLLVETAKRSIYQVDIEKEFGLRPPTVTETLKALEKKELIQRIPDENDGRKKNHCNRENIINERWSQMAGRKIRRSPAAGITKEEQQQFMNIAEKMLKI